ncbi:MAG: RtcB family protein [Proteobacteria bacterium]|nr:RtcB family protein [Pseudomonadota bacterium]
MRVDGIIYVDENLEKYLEKDAIRQVANVATLPGIVKASIAMPDIHTGYGFAIGGVAGFDLDEGVISPGGVGYDINCGVRILRSNLTKEEIEKYIPELVTTIYYNVPSGVGSSGKLKLSQQQEKALLKKGALWAVEEGFGEREDLLYTESAGHLEGADPSIISDKAYERGKAQQGTLGSGNHFLEIQYVEEVYDEDIAKKLGVFQNQVTVMIHTGSRGFGHQVCTDFIEIMHKAIKKYKIEIYDMELACAPVNSSEAQDYLSAMKASANYAWANRQCITHWTREAFMKVLGMSPKELGLSLIYDVAHNIAKIEDHLVNGEKKRLIVHRKGATRAFPPNHTELPDKYRDIGQPVIIPGDMGRASYILIGTERAMTETFGSTCHGAGRVLSRHQAIKRAKGRSIKKEMEAKGILVMSAGRETLAEEMSEAYKDITDVVDVVHSAGISRKVARLRPLGVVKG